MFGESEGDIDPQITIEILPDAYKIIPLLPDDRKRAAVKTSLLESFAPYLPDSYLSYLRAIPYMPTAVLMPAGCFSGDLIYSAYMQVRQYPDALSDLEPNPYAVTQSRLMRQTAYGELKDRIPIEYRNGIEDRLADRLPLIQLSRPLTLNRIWPANGFNSHETIVLLEHVYTDPQKAIAAYTQLFMSINQRLQERDFKSEPSINGIIEAINNFS